MRLLFNVFLASLALVLSGCSLLLDPENCASDSDCLTGGVCTDGICIGGVAEPAQPAEAGPSGGMADTGGTSGGAPDSGGSSGGEAGTGGTPALDMALDQPEAVLDVRLLDAPPTCEISSPDEDADGLLTNASEQLVTAIVRDTDTPYDALMVTINGIASPLIADSSTTVTVPLVEGENVVLLEASDPEGHRCRHSRRIIRDTMGPTLEVRRSGNVEPVGNNIETPESPLVLNIISRDGRGAATVSGLILGLPVRDVVDTGQGTFTMTVPLSGGQNALTVVAADSLDNRTTRLVNVLYDGQDPTLIVTSPVEGGIAASPTIDVTGRVSDNMGAQSIRVSARAVSAGQMGAVAAGAVSANGDFRIRDLRLFDGENSVVITARDAVGRATEVIIDVELVQGEPVIQVTEPDAAVQTIVGVARQRFSGSANRAVASVELSLGGNVTTTEPVDGQWSAELVLPAEGQFAVQVVGVGLAGGRTVPISVRLLYDGSPPSVRLTSPVEGDCFRELTIRVEGEAQDVQSPPIAVDVNGVGGVVNAGRFRVDLPVNEGMNQTVRVQTENGAGQPAEASRTFHADRTGPTLTADLVNNAYVATGEDGQISFTGRISDAGCGLAALPVVINGAPALVRADGTFSARVAGAMGLIRLTLVGYDAVNNPTRLDLDVRVDQQPPTIANVAPANDTATRLGTQTVSCVVTDASSGVASVTIGGEPVVAGLANAYSRVVPLVAGTNAIEIVATDLVGLQSRRVVSVKRDGDGPIVNLSYPTAGADVEDRLSIEGTTSDGLDGSGVASVSVEIGGLIVVAEHPVDPDGHFLINNVTLVAGANNLRVIAVDRAGNSGQTAVVRLDVLDFGSAPPSTMGLSGPTDVISVAVADMNDDGRLDILASSSAGDAASYVLLQNVNRTFQAVPFADLGLDVGVAIRRFGFGDFNSDGRMDVAYAGDGASGLAFASQAGVFERDAAPGLPTDLDATDVLVGDITRDGYLDLVYLASDGAHVFAGSFNGQYVEQGLVAAGISGLSAMTRGVLHDLNLDGVQDLVGLSDVGAVGFEGSTLGERLGQFDAYSELGIPFDAGRGFGLALIDADRDGDLDVVRGAANGVSLNGLAEASPAWTAQGYGFVFPADGHDLVSGDLNSDARDDLIVFGDSGVSVFNGVAGGFTPRNLPTTGFPALQGCHAGAVVDLDGDSDLDVIVGCEAGVFVVRSNLKTVLGASLRAVRVKAIRSPDGTTPDDAVGVTVVQGWSAVPTFVRALVHPATGPLVISFPANNRSSLTAYFIDKVLIDGTNIEAIPSVNPQGANAQPLQLLPTE